MKIFVNDKLLEFKLEEENNLYEVVDAVKKWGESNNLYVKEILFDDQTFYANQDEFKEMTLDVIEDIYFYLITPQELALSSLVDCLAFFQNLTKNSDGELYNSAVGLLELFQWVYNIVSKSKIILGLNFNQDLGTTSVNKELIKLNNFIGQFTEFAKNDPSSESTQKFVEDNINFSAWENLISGIILNAQEESNKIEDTNLSSEELKNKLKVRKMEIPDLLVKIEQITDKLHAGNDADGMMLLENIGNSLTSIIHDLQTVEHSGAIRYSDVSLDNGTVSDQLIGLTEILTQIVDSFKNNDIVLLCDLLEYELAPKLEILSDIISLVLEKIENNYN